MLLSPKHFSLAKDFVRSSSLLSCLSDEDGLSFSLPNKCPVKSPPVCTLLEEEEEHVLEPPISPSMTKKASAELEELEVSQKSPKPKEKETPKIKGNKKRVILVKSEVRRNPRVQKNKNGFKDPACNDK